MHNRVAVLLTRGMFSNRTSFVKILTKNKVPIAVIVYAVISTH